MPQSAIASLFARSPIRPLQKHMEKAVECAAHLIPFFDALMASNWDLAAAAQEDIVRFEREADVLKRDLRLHLPKSILMPVPRGDVLELLARQEQIANVAKDIAGLSLGRKLTIPPAVAEDFKVYLERSVDASKQALKAINELDELLEAGFRGKEVHIVESIISKLDEIEQDTDLREQALRHHCYAIEGEIKPIDAMFLYKVIDRVGEIADIAQRTGGRLLILLAH